MEALVDSDTLRKRFQAVGFCYIGVSKSADILQEKYIDLVG